MNLTSLTRTLLDRFRRACKIQEINQSSGRRAVKLLNRRLRHHLAVQHDVTGVETQELLGPQGADLRHDGNTNHFVRTRYHLQGRRRLNIKYGVRQVSVQFVLGRVRVLKTLPRCTGHLVIPFVPSMSGLVPLTRGARRFAVCLTCRQTDDIRRIRAATLDLQLRRQECTVDKGRRQGTDHDNHVQGLTRLLSRCHALTYRVLSRVLIVRSLPARVRQ